MNILLVNEDSANSDDLTNSLKSEGYNIFFANSGETALEIVSQTAFDLILLDIILPGIDGLETCRQLKANIETKDIAIIFLTAKTNRKDVIDGFAVGGVDYIFKPFDPDELLARIKTHLELRKVHLEKTNLIRELRDTREVLRVSKQTDILTGFHTRRDLGKILEQEKARRRMDDQLSSIILIDINELKQINNDFGEDTGDEVLVHVASLMQKTFRKQDILGRWTGSKYLIVLPRTELKTAKKLAEQLISLTVKTKFSYSEIIILISLNAGIGVFNKNIEVEGYTKQAEDCLIQAKKNGENTVATIED